MEQVTMQVTSKFDLAPIKWNAAQVKAYVAERIAVYANAVVTPDAISNAKADIANLRKLSKAISDRRIEVKKEFMQPYTDFESEVKEVVALIDGGIDNLDSQVKAFDLAKKNEKKAEIAKFFDLTAADLDGAITFERVWNEKWLNAGYKMADIESEISEKINKLRDDTEAVKGFKSEFETELMLTLQRTLDLGEVLKHKNRLESLRDAQKAKTENPPPEAEKPVTTQPKMQEGITVDTPEPKQEYVIRLYMNHDEARALGAWLKEQGIRYGKAEQSKAHTH